MPFSTVEEVLVDIENGKMVVICDDEDRENEGDLTMAAELVTAEDINFMATYGKGLICLPMSSGMIERLGLSDMERQNQPALGTAFTTSIDAIDGVTTGISAADQAQTCRVAVDDASSPEDIITPGHVFPLKAQPDGVLQRPGQTKAAGRPQAGGGYLRGHERRRHDGPCPGLREVLREARHKDGYRRANNRASQEI